MRSEAHVVSPHNIINGINGTLLLVNVNPQNTKQVPKLSRPLQDSYLHQFGGSGKNSKGVKETLARHPLRSRALEPWFHALSYVVDIAPAQAHAIVSQHGSLGQLMAIYADPSRCSHVLYVSVIQRPFLSCQELSKAHSPGCTHWLMCWQDTCYCHNAESYLGQLVATKVDPPM